MKYATTLCMLVSTALYGQENNIKIFEPTIEGKPYRSYFGEYIHANFRNKLDTLGVEGISFVKFILLKNNLVESIECDSETKKNRLLSVFFEEMIKTTSGKWANVSGSKLPETGQVLVLPISYKLQNRGKTDSTLQPDVKMLLIDFFGNYFFSANRSQKDNEYTEVRVLPPVVYVSPFHMGKRSFGEMTDTHFDCTSAYRKLNAVIKARKK